MIKQCPRCINGQILEKSCLQCGYQVTEPRHIAPERVAGGWVKHGEYKRRPISKWA